MIDIGSVRKEYISIGTPLLVPPESLERYLFTEQQLRCRLLRSLAISLTLLRAVDTVEADALTTVVMQDFDGVAV